VAVKCAGFLSGEMKIFDERLPSEVNKKYKTLDGIWFHIDCKGDTTFDATRRIQCCPLCCGEKRSGYHKKFASNSKVRRKRSGNHKNFGTNGNVKSANSAAAVYKVSS